MHCCCFLLYIIIRVDEIKHSDWLRVTRCTLFSHNVRQAWQLQTCFCELWYFGGVTWDEWLANRILQVDLMTLDEWLANRILQVDLMTLDEWLANRILQVDLMLQRRNNCQEKPVDLKTRTSRPEDQNQRSYEWRISMALCAIRRVTTRGSAVASERWVGAGLWWSAFTSADNVFVAVVKNSRRLRHDKTNFGKSETYSQILTFEGLFSLGYWNVIHNVSWWQLFCAERQLTIYLLVIMLHTPVL